MASEQQGLNKNILLRNRMNLIFGIAAQVPIYAQIMNCMINGRPPETVENTLFTFALIGIQLLGFNRYLKAVGTYEEQLKKNPEFQQKMKIEDAIARAHTHFEDVNNPRRRDMSKKIHFSVQHLPEVLRAIEKRDLTPEKNKVVQAFLRKMGLTNEKSKPIKNGDIVVVFKGYGYYGNWNNGVSSDRFGGGISVQIAQVINIEGDALEIRSVQVCDIDAKNGLTNIPDKADEVIENIYTIDRNQRIIAKTK